MLFALTKKQLQRFESRIEKTSACWNWTSCCDAHGYGTINLNYKTYKAHRISYMLYKGDTNNSLVLHLCNRPICINPDHLILGDFKANSQHMIKCGRSGTQKLNEISARVIWYMTNVKRISRQRLANAYGVSLNTITYVASGEGWGSVDTFMRRKYKDTPVYRREGTPKLNEVSARAIWFMVNVKHISRDRIANVYNIHKGNVATGRTWKYVHNFMVNRFTNLN